MMEDKPGSRGASGEATPTSRGQGPEGPHDDSTARTNKCTGGHASRGVGFYLEQTLKSQPKDVDASIPEIASVAWTGYETRRDPADVWPEVLSETRRCPECGRSPQPSGDGYLACPTCELVLAGGSP